MINAEEMKTLIARDKAMMCAIFDGDYDSVIVLANKSRLFYRDERIKNAIDRKNDSIPSQEQGG